ncbi:MAG: 30S ribosomal protein S5 [Micavibrio sp.]|nr:30S ribosomal protein S5 [Micavibrio sp.]
MARAQENQTERDEPEILERLVGINRVAKTTKGGRNMAFAALMVVGDGKGRVGYGHAKSREVPEAIKKATEQAKRKMIRVPLREGRTLHHDVKGRHGAGKVLLRSAPRGTGIIAGGPMRAVFEALGIQDIVAKAIGSNNPYSMVNATFAALEDMQNPRQVATRRNKKVSDIVSNREIMAGSEVETAIEEAEG